MQRVQEPICRPQARPEPGAQVHAPSFLRRAYVQPLPLLLGCAEKGLMAATDKCSVTQCPMRRSQRQQGGPFVPFCVNRRLASLLDRDQDTELSRKQIDVKSTGARKSARPLITTAPSVRSYHRPLIEFITLRLTTLQDGCEADDCETAVKAGYELCLGRTNPP